MCLEIQYTYPCCTHLVKIGKYACYQARHAHDHAKPTPTEDTPPSSSPPGFPPNTPTPIRHPHIADLYDSPRLTYPEDLLDFPSPLRLGLKKEKPITIKTLLSKRYEDTSRVGRCESKHFNVYCESFNVYQQPMRTGDTYCYRCTIEERRRERAQSAEEMRLLGVEFEDGEEELARPLTRRRSESIRLVAARSSPELGSGEGMLDFEFGERMSPRSVVDEVERDTEAVRRAREVARMEIENAREDLKGVEIDIGSGGVEMMDVGMANVEVENVKRT